MRDYLAWRLAFGVTTPSTNTVVQPEYDDMRPAGVTNHLARMHGERATLDALTIGHIDCCEHGMPPPRLRIVVLLVER